MVNGKTNVSMDGIMCNNKERKETTEQSVRE